MEARYVKVASRFFLAGNGNAGAGAGEVGERCRHFLDLCKRDITSDRHIFMYRGDAAFCSDECRQDQRNMDAALKAARRRHRVPAGAGVCRERHPGGDATASDHRGPRRPRAPVVPS